MIPLFIQIIEDDNDREFIANIYTKYEKLLYKTAISITQNCCDAQDVIQSVFVKIIQSKIPLLKSLPEQKQLNYLVTACHNTAINAVKKHRKVYNLNIDNIDNDVSGEYSISIDDHFINEEICHTFLVIWESLDERTKYFLNARYILEKSSAEIAADLQISPSHVRTYLSRARKKALQACKNLLDK